MNKTLVFFIRFDQCYVRGRNVSERLILYATSGIEFIDYIQFPVDSTVYIVHVNLICEWVNNTKLASVSMFVL